MQRSAPIPHGGTAVMARRLEPPSSLDFFPTPPWATRALFPFLNGRSAWEPAAGEGHMSAVLAEFFAEVIASDVFDYEKGFRVGSFVGEGPDCVTLSAPVDWIITNPPFNLASQFALHAIREARKGVALLTRTAWLEGGARYRSLFSDRPPALVGLFSERVPMVKGRWDPNASTATSYCWVIWRVGHAGPTAFTWIPPGQRQALTRPDDAVRFAGTSA